MRTHRNRTSAVEAPVTLVTSGTQSLSEATTSRDENLFGSYWERVAYASHLGTRSVGKRSAKFAVYSLCTVVNASIHWHTLAP